MSNEVQFDEDSFGKKPIQSNSGRSNFQGTQTFTNSQVAEDMSQSKMVRFLMRHGLAKSPQSAQQILIIVAALNLIITIIIIFKFLL